jgi:anti-sigma B factor antagonist
MTVQLNQESGRTVLRPAGEFNIYCAVEFRDALVKAVASGGDLEIDLAAVSEMDAAGLQLLLVARREADASGKRLYLTGSGAAALEVMQLCNVTGCFESAPAAQDAQSSAAA